MSEVGTARDFLVFCTTGREFWAGEFLKKASDKKKTQKKKKGGGTMSLKLKKVQRKRREKWGKNWSEVWGNYIVKSIVNKMISLEPREDDSSCQHKRQLIKIIGKKGDKRKGSSRL